MVTALCLHRSNCPAESNSYANEIIIKCTARALGVLATSVSHTLPWIYSWPFIIANEDRKLWISKRTGCSFFTSSVNLHVRIAWRCSTPDLFGINMIECGCQYSSWSDVCGHQLTKQLSQEKLISTATNLLCGLPFHLSWFWLIHSSSNSDVPVSNLFGDLDKLP